MKKEIYYLPNDFKGYTDSDFSILFYSSTRSSLKQKVIFTANLINIILTGRKEIYTNDSFSTVDNTQLVLLPSGNVLMSELTASEAVFQSIIITFSNKFFQEFIEHYNISVAKNQTNGTLNIINKDSYILSFQNSLIEIKQLKPSSLLFKIKIEEILLYLINENAQLLNLFTFNLNISDEKQKFKTLVESNKYTYLSSTELAFLCNMSLSTFKRHFTEVFNTSPHKYFSKHKMNKAKRLLLANKLASEIFTELGYESLSSFSIEFKKHFGLTPKQFQLEFEPKAKVFELSA